MFGAFRADDPAFPSSSPYYDKGSRRRTRHRQAKTLLKEAGVPTFSFEMQVANSPVDQQVAQVIQAMVAEAGIDIKLRSSEFATMLKSQTAGDFQATRVGWSGRVDPDGNLHQFVTTGGGINDTKFSNPIVDKELNASRLVYDVAARKAHFDAAAKVLREERRTVEQCQPASSGPGTIGELSGLAALRDLCLVDPPCPSKVSLDESVDARVGVGGHDDASGLLRQFGHHQLERCI